jgi:LPS export ABC transporter protein LptC
MRFRVDARVVAFAMLMAVMVAACDREKQAENATEVPGVPDEIVTEFATQESDSGRVQWTLKAPHAERFNARNVFLMDDPVIEFYDRLGNLQTTLTAEKGEYLLESHDMLAYGNVVAVTNDGDVLETDSLRYLNKTDKIVSDSFVKLTRGNDVLTGYGLECDHTLDSVDIKRDVKAIIVEEDGKFEQ